MFVRVALGAAVLVPIVFWRRQWGLLRGHWRWVAAFAVVEITFTFLALTWAEERISSSLAALLIAAVPIVGAIFAWAFGLDTHWSPRRGIGLAIGFLGVAPSLASTSTAARGCPSRPSASPCSATRWGRSSSRSGCTTSRACP